MKAMQRRALVLVSSSLLLSSLALAAPTPSPTPAPTPIPTYQPKPILIQCVDPAATDIDYTLVAKKTKSTGTVRIKGTVKNIGTVPYVSRADQQEAQLLEIRPGTNNPQVIARQPFQNLAVGETVSISVDKSWNTADEFPSTFRLSIVYDPDIRSDGNTKNDDCRMTNNTKDRAGSDINTLFR